jgi:hypothetical protein
VWAYGLLFVLFAVTTGAQIYYLAGTYPYLLAAGFVAVDGWLAARRGRVRNLMLATALTTAAALLIVLPVLPAADAGWTCKVSTANGESVGWPQLVQAVHTVWVSLPPAQRAQAVIFTSNYDEAGAINELGRADGLPTAVSGHNTEWWWVPGDPRATTMVAVGGADYVGPAVAAAAPLRLIPGRVPLRQEQAGKASGRTWSSYWSASMGPPTRHQRNSHPKRGCHDRRSTLGEAARTFTLSLAPRMSRRWPHGEGANASIGSSPLLSAWPKRQTHWNPRAVSAEFQRSS